MQKRSKKDGNEAHLETHLEEDKLDQARDTVDATPSEPAGSDRITVVVMSRLVYRKGTDILAGVIPTICAKYPEVDFLIGGDGPKRLAIEEIREKNGLLDRVTLLGAVDHAKVPEVLRKVGD